MYRGKDIETGEWRYGYYVVLGDTHYIVIKPTKKLNQDDFSDFVEVIPASVGQWTGLNDKNGVEIYQNDVLVINAIRWEVLWSQYSLGFVLSPYSENGIAFAAAEEVFCVDCENDNDTRQEIEIVGNTTDNPELLTK